MTSPGPFGQQPNPQQPYPPQQYPSQQYPNPQQPYAPQQPQYPTQQPQFATPQPPAQPGYAQQQPQPGQPTSFRTLTLDLKNAPWYGWTFLQPTVTIDGFRYSAGWSRMQYQVPADRPVYVQCHVAYLWEYGKAATTLQPNQNPHLEYTVPSNAWVAGDIGAPGTTTSKGKGLTIGVLCFLGAVIVGSIGLAIISIALAAGSY
ncbi:hypothetical protein CLV49_2731 [Labedella gwakjiensis]|uniref:Uncharacterized protein n=1 Tax=Labedella gwakjiensis TaxID=390269 RepID=A0A2P8GYQ0_9MICO|nr:hypothetical protein [Labedella gwakjiensis]PSL39099.1 hypothetical protein CLV49_2731 [Labedella gwakjiensis]RUQ86454.1 hypothetical protein ELQ93_05570 [Labedella gwakjiensis]